jgi:hypothetical protein
MRTRTARQAGSGRIAMKTSVPLARVQLNHEPPGQWLTKLVKQRVWNPPIERKPTINA